MSCPVYRAATLCLQCHRRSLNNGVFAMRKVFTLHVGSLFAGLALLSSSGTAGASLVSAHDRAEPCTRELPSCAPYIDANCRIEGPDRIILWWDKCLAEMPGCVVGVE